MRNALRDGHGRPRTNTLHPDQLPLTSPLIQSLSPKTLTVRVRDLVDLPHASTSVAGLGHVDNQRNVLSDFPVPQTVRAKVHLRLRTQQVKQSVQSALRV